jgi:hypothetical protein
MNFTRTLIAAALIASGGAAFAQASINQNLALAGNVTPGDTPGFPVTLSQPGSYKLTSNLFVPSGVSGVVITAPDVTLDLNGFSIVGAVTCTQNTTTLVVTCTGQSAPYDGYGVLTTFGSIIKNGTVKGFERAGVYAAGGGVVVERLHVTQSYDDGLVQGDDAAGLRIIDSRFTLNNRNGASVRASVTTGSMFMNNGLRGFAAGTAGALMLDSVAMRNGDIGITGAVVNRTHSFGNNQNLAGAIPLGVNMNRDQFANY